MIAGFDLCLKNEAANNLAQIASLQDSSLTTTVQTESEIPTINAEINNPTINPTLQNPTAAALTGLFP